MLTFCVVPISWLYCVTDESPTALVMNKKHSSRPMLTGTMLSERLRAVHTQSPICPVLQEFASLARIVS